MGPASFFVLFLVCFESLITATDGCYFPQEFLGEFTMQTAISTGSTIQYSNLNITANSIPIWGNCYRRIGNNYILMLNYGENSCIRCLHLKLRSRNVLQVLASSQETISKCYINEESATATCPTESSLKSHSVAEIILFKTKDIEGNAIGKEYCPIDGKFSVDYKISDVSARDPCTRQNSSIDSCPSGSTLNLRFHNCARSYEFDCLGHWEGPDKQNYLALLDKQPQREGRPQYRCALYKRDPQTGIVRVALSKDSTCTSELYNASHGYETMVLTPQPEHSWPVEVLFSQCSFPDWMQGYWEHMTVERDTLTYKDHNTFTTYIIKCVGNLESEEKYLVYSRNQCGEEQYNCIHVMKRSDNIMEFQLGTNSSSKNEFDVLCMDSNFKQDAWITQGRLENSTEHPGMCPISGEYTSIIPDTTDLCAKLWSDCRAPELMYYQVSDCITLELYEEREYKCLGHWREADLLYTYTQRKDVAAGTYECFVGSIITDNDIFIKEAGEHCQRHVDPLTFGMKLNRQREGLYSCVVGQDSTTGYDSVSKTHRTSTPTNLPTKPWNAGVPSYPAIPEETDTNKISAGTQSRSTFVWFALPASIVIFCKFNYV